MAAGFDSCGFASAQAPWPATARLREFLAEGRHGDMAWMETHAARRGHPTALWPEARTAVMLGLNYAPEKDPLESLNRPRDGTISVYAVGDDYHDVIKSRLKSLAHVMQSALGGSLKVFVDTAPLMEKPLAERAGIGWQGKHTNLVSRDFGSWLFLGAILTTLDLAPDPAQDDHCGACQRCLEICPTQAFPAPYQLDARRCIAYLTIEFAGPIPLEFRSQLGNRIYGCDDCLAVCPWNKFAKAAHELRLKPRPELHGPQLADLVALDDPGFRTLFRKSPIKRIGRNRFVRNVLYAIGNSRDPSLATAASPLCSDPDPVVRDAAAWALDQLATISPS